MSGLKDGGSAFPITVHMEGHDRYSEAGMSLRDYFAARALHALIMHNGEESAGNVQINAERSYQYADAMLAARAKA